MAGCEGKSTNCDGDCGKIVQIEGYCQGQRGTFDTIWSPTITFASNLCMICAKEIEKTITLKNGTLLKLCKEHLEEVEDQFAKKVIERHYYPQPYTSPYTSPNIPYTPVQPIWSVYPLVWNTCTNPQIFSGVRTYC